MENPNRNISRQTALSGQTALDGSVMPNNSYF